MARHSCSDPGRDIAPRSSDKACTLCRRRATVSALASRSHRPHPRHPVGFHRPYSLYESVLLDAHGMASLLASACNGPFLFARFG